MLTIQRNPGVHFDDYFHLSQYVTTRSLLFLTFAINNRLGGQNVLGYHLVNLGLHILNGILIFGIACQIFRKVEVEQTRARLLAFCAAAFFLVHPVQTEAVTYISSRSELLSAFFYLAGLGCFAALPENRIGFFASLAVLVSLLLGFGGKETVVTLPLAIIVFDYIFIAKGEWRSILKRWRFYISFIIAGAAASYYLLARQVADLVTQRSGKNYETWTYFVTQLRVIIRYMRLLVFPTGLTLDYDFPLYTSFREPVVILSALVILAFIFLGWKWRRTKPIYSFSILWFFITLSPTSSIVPIPDVIFEHRLYLPLAGVCLSFPVVLEWAVRKVTGNTTIKWVTAAAGVLLVLFTIGTILRNEVWRDETRLFTDVVSKAPHKLRAYNELIYADMKRGQEEHAISVAKLGLQNIPVADVFLNDTIGNLQLRLGRPAEAAASFKASREKAKKLGGWPPEFFANSYNNLGVAYLALSKATQGSARIQALQEARDAFEASLEASPYDINTIDSLVNVRRSLGEAKLLENELRKKLKDGSTAHRYFYALAALLSLEERYADALPYFAQAEPLDLDVVYFNYAFALAKAGRIDDAIAEYLKAIRKDLMFDEARYNLALLYIQKADYDSATFHLKDILNRNPRNVRANVKLAQIQAYTGKPESARQYIQRALNIDPQNAEALALAQQIGNQ